MKLLHIISGASPESGGPIQGIRNYHEASHSLGIERTVVCFENQADLNSWNFSNSLKLIGLGNANNHWQRNPTFQMQVPNGSHQDEACFTLMA